MFLSDSTPSRDFVRSSLFTPTEPGRAFQVQPEPAHNGGALGNVTLKLRMCGGPEVRNVGFLDQVAHANQLVVAVRNGPRGSANVGGWASRQQTPTAGTMIMRLATMIAAWGKSSLAQLPNRIGRRRNARRHNQSHSTMSAAGNRIKQIGSRCHQRPSFRPIHAAAIVRPAAIAPSASSKGHCFQTGTGACVSMADSQATNAISNNISKIENCQGGRLPTSAVDSFAAAVGGTPVASSAMQPAPRSSIRLEEHRRSQVRRRKSSSATRCTPRRRRHEQPNALAPTQPILPGGRRDSS